ncbi:MAG: hypothetical protein HOP18_22215 [Deltaproteobacteria bacterium]|nr:hypothetical protein [Deltaproteobacteria bacterium]
MMHPLTELYSRLISLCGLSLRLGGVALVVGVVCALCQSSGVWDVAQSTTPPLPLARLATAAQLNPVLRLEAALFGPASSARDFAQRCERPLPRVHGPIVSVAWWRLVWDWLSAPNPLVHNPYPTLRAARWQETRQTVALFLVYYLVHLRMVLVIGSAGMVGWLCFAGSHALRRRRRQRGVARLSERLLQRDPVRLPVATGRFLTLALPAPLVQFIASCRTARQLLAIFAAHQTWPASLSHHGDGTGGLLAHTLRAFRLALAHPAATDPALRQAFLLTVLAHDVGKVLAYAPRPTGGYRLASYYHANRSADLVMAAGLWRECAPGQVEAILTALRASAAPSVVPIPENAPPEATRLLHWLSEIDHQAVSEDVADLQRQLAQADIHVVLPRLWAAPAPTPELPAPLYREGGTPYLLREPARMVVLQLLHLDEHPGARATTGRKDPVWERCKQVLHELGATQPELRLTLPTRPRPFQALAMPPALVADVRNDTGNASSCAEGHP